ncbi:MAG: response regulator, partial [Litorimonas sp.]
DGPEGAIKAIVDAKHGKIAADTLILDYQMPVVDGEKLYRKLYEKGLTQHLRIIVLTSVDGDELRVRLLNMGVEKVLTKPISIEQLKSVLCCEVQYNTELDRLIS